MKKSLGAPIGMGCAFTAVFWQVFNNLPLGIVLGVAMGVAFIKIGKTKNNGQKQNNDKS
jgi:MFS superfamily sulfate permease-like transporter